MRELRHKNIVLFYGAGYEPSGRPFLVTEFMERGSLQKILLDTSIPLPWHRRFQFAIDAANGMNFLHTKNPPRIHRDLKSANLLVAQDWTVKISDFGTTGLASHLSGTNSVHADVAGQTLFTTSAIGTVCWTAPEILRNEPYGLEVDVFSFGIVMYEVWHGMMVPAPRHGKIKGHSLFLYSDSTLSRITH
eukprot:m.215733 g.215733  ORF g.215733 m.215733 type:complete len:190 (-) comp16978_c0_seq18:338-907(-)